MPIIDPMYFYLVHVLDTLSTISVLAVAAAITGMFLLGVLCVPFYVWGENEQEILIWAKKFFKSLLKVLVVAIILATIIPTRDTVIYMIIAKEATYDRLEKGKQEIKEIADYIIEKVKAKE